MIGPKYFFFFTKVVQTCLEENQFSRHQLILKHNITWFLEDDKAYVNK